MKTDFYFLVVGGASCLQQVGKITVTKLSNDYSRSSSSTVMPMSVVETTSDN